MRIQGNEVSISQSGWLEQTGEGWKPEMKSGEVTGG